MGDEISFSERIFFNFADRNENLFKKIKEDLIKANYPKLYQNYVSMAIFYVIIAFIFSFFVAIGLLLITKKIVFLLIILIPILIAILFFVGPSMEAKNFSKKINDELPFAVIYMAAISQSNIEPLRMFKLLANSKEYPNLASEIRKILKQTEFFGYNLADVLKDYSSKTGNEKLKELFSGIAINIVSGGSLKNFLEKKADNLLFEYKLERQKYNNIAGTFLDVYISILIVAPLILIILLVIMINSGFKMPISTSSLSYLFILILIILNLIFLTFLQIKQPKT
ncbi:MAG: type II secretion system F family protein [Candidatus Pacearchaeota archaeon]